ncbi:MAG: DUF2336 domain-containing protein [Methylacidiphilales bacterium]|nr:DUF2336 domain-containing protein [Candidatus Methylacidiphilales bacterium]
MSHVDQTLRSITNMFIAGLDHYSDEQVEKLDVELNRLVGIVDAEARAELSRSLAPLRHAPVQVIRRLAFEDDISIAGPVLETSPLLNSADLAHLARSRSSDHLAAICERPALDIVVTDALLEHGDGEISRKVAAHPGADLSLSGFGLLVGRAQRDDTLAVSVGTRANIPMPVLKALLSHIGSEVRARIQAHAEVNMSGGGDDNVRCALAETMRGPEKPRDFNGVRTEILSLHQAGALGDANVRQFAIEKRLEHTVVALSLLTDTPADLIERVFHHSLKALLVPCRAADLSWPTVTEVMKLCVALHSTTRLDLDSYQASYVGLTRTAALSVLRYWVVQGLANADGTRCQQTRHLPKRHASRRRAPRRLIQSRGAVATLDGRAIATCTIADVSAGGAKLVFAQATEVPERIVLLLSASGDARRICDVMWRDDTAIGVRFCPASRTSETNVSDPTANAAAKPVRS